MSSAAGNEQEYNSDNFKLCLHHSIGVFSYFKILRNGQVKILDTQRCPIKEHPAALSQLFGLSASSGESRLSKLGSRRVLVIALVIILSFSDFDQCRAMMQVLVSILLSSAL